MASIRFENVVKHYGAYQAIRNVSFAIPDGEFVVIVGPSGDPAEVKGAADAAAAMGRIAAAESAFASRGDDSGTHQAEKALWAKAGVAPAGDWYRETGSGMGATLPKARRVVVSGTLQPSVMVDRKT